MTQEIAYGGYTANPSDHECSDGDLALAVGLVPEDGAVKPVLPAKEMYELSAGQKVVALHETPAFLHYIVVDSGVVEAASDSEAETLATDIVTANPFSLMYFTDDDQTRKPIHTFDSGETIRSVETIGNTLIVLTTEHIHYFLWKADNQDYLYLGTHLPELPISFGLQGEMIREEEFTITFDRIHKEDIWDEFSDDNKTKITEQVLAQVNKFIAEYSTNAGKFIYPFLVRYAYRLYDGSLTMHSSPVLMICSSDLAPEVFWTSINRDGLSNYYDEATLQIASMVHSLDYAVTDQSAIDELLNWEDIVRSVDIFVSQPIYTYDQNGECTQFVDVEDSDCYCVCKHINQAVSEEIYPLQYQHHTFSKLYAFTFNPSTLEYPVSRLIIPKRSADTVKEDIATCSTFYILKSIKLESLTTTRTILEVAEDYLQSLVNREAMTDDYDSHDKLIPTYSFAYNNRLNLANLQKILYSGFDTSALVCYSDGYIANYTNALPTERNYTSKVSVWIYIKEDGKDIIVYGEDGEVGRLVPILFIYYPNINAYKAVIELTLYNVSERYEVALEQHDFLNGAFYYGGWDGLSELYTGTVPTESSEDDRTVDLPNSIYTSEISNPFYFPTTNINTVGVGTIIGISSAAKALSQGQFGEFPLYAFCSDGVWALSVSSDGGYSAIQPITRDVCINTDSITQIDSAVLFATNRGIMLISGSNVLCISDPLKSEDIFSLTDLPRYDKLLQVYNNKADESEQLTVADIDMLQFLEFVSGCQMVYDYTNQHIIIYNPSVKYAYVYSLKSQKWGMIHSTITSSFNSYPRALAMQGTTLVNFSESDAMTVTTFAITRPFKMGDGNAFKTIDTIIQRGYFKSDHVCQVLYGSNDLFHWFPVWSSVDKYLRGFRGSPYKAFRLALVGKLDRAESIYGFTVQFNPRLANQPR